MEEHRFLMVKSGNIGGCVLTDKPSSEIREEKGPGGEPTTIISEIAIDPMVKGVLQQVEGKSAVTIQVLAFKELLVMVTKTAFRAGEAKGREDVVSSN